MPIYRLFKDWAFEPEQCRAMALAYEDVLADLGLDRVDPSCELVAMKIIELAKQGVAISSNCARSRLPRSRFTQKNRPCESRAASRRMRRREARSDDAIGDTHSHGRMDCFASPVAGRAKRGPVALSTAATAPPEPFRSPASTPL